MLLARQNDETVANETERSTRFKSAKVREEDVENNKNAASIFLDSYLYTSESSFLLSPGQVNANKSQANTPIQSDGSTSSGSATQSVMNNNSNSLAIAVNYVNHSTSMNSSGTKLQQQQEQTPMVKRYSQRGYGSNLHAGDIYGRLASELNSIKLSASPSNSPDSNKTNAYFFDSYLYTSESSIVSPPSQANTPMVNSYGQRNVKQEDVGNNLNAASIFLDSYLYTSESSILSPPSQANTPIQSDSSTSSSVSGSASSV